MYIREYLEVKRRVAMAKNIAVFGIYRTRPEVEEAVRTLKNSDFRATDISVLFSDNVGTKDFAVEKHTKLPEGSSAGAGTGAVIGGVLGWLTGIGLLVIPGIGPFIAAGPVVSMLAGVGAGSVVGGLAGALVGMGIPEYEAKRYEGRIKEGGILLSVHSDNAAWKKRAMEILKQTGAVDIGTEGEGKADFADSDRPGPRSVS